MKLSGVRVLDLSLFLPGPFLTQMMADHGADVIKLEPAGSGEPNRDIGPKINGRSVYFCNTHRNKKSIQLNLKNEMGKQIFFKLVETCDVVVEAFRPGVVDRLGVGYDAVKEVNPSIIYCSMSAWGQTGPYAQKPAHDLATEAIAGILSLNVGSNGKPAIPGIAGADMLSSMMTLSGILMALFRRSQTGEGDYIDVAMADSLVAAIPNNMGTVFSEGKSPVLSEERALGGYAMYQIYQTKDERHVVLGGSEMHFAKEILKKLKREDLIKYCMPPPGPTQKPVIEFLTETFKKETQDYWIKYFDGINASFAPVKNLKEAVDDPQIRHRKMIFEDPKGQLHIGIPIKFANEPGHEQLTFADVGQHSQTILKDLGYTGEEIKDFVKGGVI